MEYWDKRFVNGGKIWGEEPSNSAKHALDLFRKKNVKTILVPGAGYGRNTKLFSNNQYNVSGIEISDTAYNMALTFDPNTKFFKGSVFELIDLNESYDAIYCFNVLHLFKESDRLHFLKICDELLTENGVIYFTVFSEREASFGKGKEIESNTFESKVGRPVHYFTEDDLKNHFRDFNILKSGIIEENENQFPF